MKRMIKAQSLSSVAPYKRTKAYIVTKIYLAELLKKFSESASEAIIRGVLLWKNMNNLVYHHKDKDTSNNIVSNIILMDNSGHSTLHSNLLRLAIITHKAEEAGYQIGPLAEEREKEVLLEVSNLLHFENHTVQQIIDTLTNVTKYIDELAENDPDSIQDFVINTLDSTTINFVRGQDVRKLIRDNKQIIDYSAFNVIYIDEPSAKDMLRYINNNIRRCLAKAEQEAAKPNGDPGWFNVRRKSFEALKQFVEHNTRDFDITLQEYYAKQQNK